MNSETRSRLANPSFIGGEDASEHIWACRESLAAFVQATVNFPLHEWQWKHLCPLIETLATERGVRLLIHAPPQFGKSLICSKRFPAWALGRLPLTRIVLAGYNEEHAITQFAEPVKDVMLSPFYKECFPHFMCQLAKPIASRAFSTVARAMCLDGQESLTAVGLLSGFTGKGVGPGDILIVDDPYSGPDAANSPVINEKVWRWWKELVSPRVHPHANVLFMYHRYHDDDIAARLLRENPGAREEAL